MVETAIVLFYFILLLAIGFVSTRRFRGTAADYFVASQSVGSFLFFTSVFGTTMTSFALVGSTSEAYRTGIGVYGKMASWSGLVHSAIFLLVGVKLWGLGRKHGYVTQVQFFRERFGSDLVGTILFPVLVAFLIPYLLIGFLGVGSVLNEITTGAFPGIFPGTRGGIPPWLGMLITCLVVLSYVLFGGLRGAVWANALQTMILMGTGLAAFLAIAWNLGGLAAASAAILPDRLVRAHHVGHLEFLSYGFVPLSVGMFPHLFQHWLTARSARTFKMAIVLQPVCIMLVWLPCVLIGLWATGARLDGHLVIPPQHPPNHELAMMVKLLTHRYVAGLLGAAIFMAVMSSLDSQLFCLGTMFTEDVVVHWFGKERFKDEQVVWMARGFILFITLLSYALALTQDRRVFALGVWCFSGFAGLFPLVVAALYWRRATRDGVLASLAVTLITWGTLFARSGYGADPGFLVLDMLPAALIVPASATALVLVSLVTRPPDGRVLGKFFA